MKTWRAQKKIQLNKEEEQKKENKKGQKYEEN